MSISHNFKTRTIFIHYFHQINHKVLVWMLLQQIYSIYSMVINLHHIPSALHLQLLTYSHRWIPLIAKWNGKTQNIFKQRWQSILKAQKISVRICDYDLQISNRADNDFISYHKLRLFSAQPPTSVSHPTPPPVVTRCINSLRPPSDTYMR